MSSGREKEGELSRFRGILLERITLLMCVPIVLPTDIVENCNPLDTFTPAICF